MATGKDWKETQECLQTARKLGFEVEVDFSIIKLSKDDKDYAFEDTGTAMSFMRGWAAAQVKGGS